MINLNHTELATEEDKTFSTDLWAREDFEYWERIKENGHKRELEKKEKALAEKDEALAEKEKALAEKDVALANFAEKENQHQQELIEKDQEIADLKARLAALESSSRQN